MVAEKGREKERKWRKEAAGKLPPLVLYCQREVIVTNLDSSLYTAQSKGNYKKTETKSYYKDKMGRTEKLQQKQQKREIAGEQCWRGE